MTSQPGLVATYLMERPNGDRVACSIWESEELMREGMTRANAVPLLPGQRGEDIPGPTRVEQFQVISAFVDEGKRDG